MPKFQKKPVQVADEITVSRELLEHAAHVYREAGREDTNGYRTITGLLAKSTSKES